MSKNAFKWLVIVLLTAGAAFAGFKYQDMANQTITKSGSPVNVSLDTNYYMVIDAQNVTASAGSPDFFALTHTGEDPFVPTQKDSANPPIGWDHDTYFAKSPTVIPGGRWNVTTGSPVVTIQNGNQPVTVRMIPTDKYVNDNKSFAVFIGIAIWVLCLLFLGMGGFYAW